MLSVLKEFMLGLSHGNCSTSLSLASTIGNKKNFSNDYPFLCKCTRTNLLSNNHRTSDTSSSVHRNPLLIHEPTPLHEEIPDKIWQIMCSCVSHHVITNNPSGVGKHQVFFFRAERLRYEPGVH